jgi:hypothetical protein
MTYFSPAAAEGKDPNRSGCLGNGDSLTVIRACGNSIKYKDIRKVRVLEGFFGSNSLFRIIREERH